MVLAFKKDGTLRLSVDYRRLNAVSAADAYPMPRVDDILDRLGRAKFFTIIDLTRGYWQIPVAQDSQAKTAFSTPFGLFQFRRLTFSLQSAPATFQRMMDTLIAKYRDFADVYLDDLIVFSKTWDEHLQHVKCILDQLRAAGLTAKLRKWSVWCSTSALSWPCRHGGLGEP